MSNEKFSEKEREAKVEAVFRQLKTDAKHDAQSYSSAQTQAALIQVAMYGALINKNDKYYAELTNPSSAVAQEVKEVAAKIYDIGYGGVKDCDCHTGEASNLQKAIERISFIVNDSDFTFDIAPEVAFSYVVDNCRAAYDAALRAVTDFGKELDEEKRFDVKVHRRESLVSCNEQGYLFVSAFLHGVAHHIKNCLTAAERKAQEEKREAEKRARWEREQLELANKMDLSLRMQALILKHVAPAEFNNLFPNASAGKSPLGKHHDGGSHGSRGSSGKSSGSSSSHHYY